MSDDSSRDLPRRELIITAFQPFTTYQTNGSNFPRRPLWQWPRGSGVEDVLSTKVATYPGWYHSRH